MQRLFKTFKGGFGFRSYSGQPRNQLLESKVPSSVVIPLRQGFSTEVKPLVDIGDTVFAGQIIGRDDASISSPVHSPVSGVVEGVRRLNYFKRDTTMILIRTNNASQEIARLRGCTTEWWKLSNEKIEELIYLSGASSLDREGIPTRFKSSVILPDDVKHLIIHGVGSEPYNVSLEVLLEGKRLLNFFEGLKILKRIMPYSKVRLAINSHKRRLIEELEKLAYELEWLDIYALEPKYPQGYDEMLVPTILEQKFPYGYSAANIGVVVLNIQAVLAVYNAVAEGMPLIERIIAICGPAFKENVHLKTRVGTPLGEVLSGYLGQESTRVAMNSLLTGVLLNDFSLPIDRTLSQVIAIPENKTREFLAFLRPGLRRDSYSRTFLANWLPYVRRSVDANLHGEERPCISCSFCEEVCPVRIIPHLLAKYVKQNIIDETIMNYEIFNCIECGLCSFVCPSKIPLVKLIKDGQDRLIMQGCDRTQCVLPYFNLKGIEEYRGVTKL